MTDQPVPMKFAPPPPELIDCDGNVWTRLYPRAGQVAVPLSAEHLGAIADYERRKGGFLAPLYEALKHEANTSESQRVTPRIRIVAHGADDGVDLLGRRWVLAAPAQGVAVVPLTAAEADVLANLYADSAATARDDGRLDQAKPLAARSLQLREVAHTIDPALTLHQGHPRFRDLAGNG